MLIALNVVYCDSTCWRRPAAALRCPHKPECLHSAHLRVQPDEPQLPAELHGRPLLRLAREWALLRYPSTIASNSSSPICTFRAIQKLFSGFQAFRFLLLFCFSIEYSSNNHRSSLSRIIENYYSIILIWTIGKVLIRLAARVRLGRCSQQRHRTITHRIPITSPYFFDSPTDFPAKSVFGGFCNQQDSRPTSSAAAYPSLLLY